MSRATDSQAKRGRGTHISLIEKPGPTDVTFGRGAAVAELPGNVHFRQIVNKYRGLYVSAERAGKSSIAKQVLAELGGARFLEKRARKGGQGYCYVQTSAGRKMEKICQSLREKYMSKVPPLSGANIENGQCKRNTPRMSPKLRGDKSALSQKSGKSRTPVHDLMVTASTEEEDDFFTEDDEGGEGQEVAAVQPLFTSEQQSLYDSSLEQALRAEAGDMIARLCKFQTQFNHTAVPPGWRKDPVLADWCSIQRQQARSVKAGFLILTDEQRRVTAQLEQLDFCWEFEHWISVREVSKQKQPHPHEQKQQQTFNNAATATQSFVPSGQEVDTSPPHKMADAILASCATVTPPPSENSLRVVQ